MNAMSYGQIPQTAKFRHHDVYAGGSVPVIEAIIDDQGSRTGDIGNGGYTDDGRPEITGKGNPGDLIHIYDGSELLGRVRVAANGVWTFTPIFPLSDGRHSISILHETDDGDVSDLSEPYVIFVDKVAPEAPSIDEVLDDAGPQTGAIGNGGGTDDNTPTLSGKGEAGATVTIIDNGQVIGETLVDADGSWVFTPDAELADGQHEFEVVVTDQAGNTSDHSEKHIIVVKAAVPTQIATVTAMGKDWGVSSGDWLTNDGGAGRLMQGSLSAQLAADERLLVSTDGGVSWSVASVDGLRWAAQDNNSHSGNWSIQTMVVNDAGRSGEVESRAVFLDTLAPDAPTQLSVDGSYLTVAFKTAAVTAGDIVSVVLNGQRFDQALTVKDVAAGSVRIYPGFAVASGDVMAAIIDKAGNSSKYRDMGDNKLIDFNNAGYVNLSSGNSTTYNGLRITSEVDHDVWQIPDAITGLTSYDPAVYTGMKIGVTGRTRIDFTEGPVSELKFLVTNLQAGCFDPSVVKFYTAGGALVGQLSLSAYWPNSLNASFKAPAGQDFSYMVVSTGYKVPGYTGIGSWDWIGLDDFQIRGGASELNVLGNQTIDGNTGTYYGGDEDNVFSLATVANLTAPSSGGVSGGAGVDTLKLTGANQTLDLAVLEGRIDSIEIIDITGTGNNSLSLSLQDVLANGQVDLFHQGAKQTVQMMVKGNAGDVVKLDDLLGAGGPDLGDWASMGKHSIDGVSYVVYQHTGLDAELLVQDAVRVDLI